MNVFTTRAKRPAKARAAAKGIVFPANEQRHRMPEVADFLAQRDFTGAVAVLDFKRQVGDIDNETLPMLGYAAFHLGDFQKALITYEELLKGQRAKQKDTAEITQSDSTYHLYAAACHYYLGNYKEAKKEALLGPAKNALQNRLLFHIAHKLNDDEKLKEYHQKLTTMMEDQLSLAAMHFMRNHWQEATDIYKRLLLESRDSLAFQVYIALCYYKLDYYDVSIELLTPYLQRYPDSAITLNLKACNHFKLYDGKAAEQELKSLLELLASSPHKYESDLIKHNLVVFRNGEKALQVLPSLYDVLPEARLNMVIYFLKNADVEKAFELIKDLEPSTPSEYILKGVTHAIFGQQQDSKVHLQKAQQYFQLVGASASECDTIPGRQCMASCFFLLKQFDDVIIYFNSIKPYSLNDNAFNYNFGLTLASVGKWQEAEESLLLVTDEDEKSDFIYTSWLARCYIMNGKPRDAWELYLNMQSNADSFALLVQIANDCYKIGSFYYSAKAFDVLSRLDPSPEYWDGKRGACCGVFQQVVARKTKIEHLRDVLNMLRNTQSTPQTEYIISIISKWSSQNGGSNMIEFCLLKTI